MKRVSLFVLALIIVLSLTACGGTRTFDLKNITTVEITDGTNGNIVEITEQEQIQLLTQPFNENEFRRGESSKNRTGWSYRLRFYQNDKMATEIIIMSSGRIDFNNSFYDCKNGAINIDYYEELLNASPLSFTERLGFEGGNIGAGGIVCGGDDGYIYYRSEDDGWKLYKAKPDGSEKVKVSDRIAYNINVLDGWIYFLDFPEDSPIYKVRTDSTSETKLADGACNHLYVAESGIYFDKRDDNNESHIYRADLDGGNMTLLFPEASLMYYFKGMIYLGAAQLGVYDIETGTKKVLAETAVHNVSVDDSGIYYWAVDKGEYRCMNLDGSNDRLILRGGDFFNYSNGNLYYMGISENKNGPCHVINRLTIATNETTTLIEEANEFFNAHGEWSGITFNQIYNHPETLDPELLKPNAQGEIEIGESESVGYVFVSGENLYMRAALRESIFQTGKLGCIARLDGVVMIWD